MGNFKMKNDEQPVSHSEMVQLIMEGYYRIGEDDLRRPLVVSPWGGHYGLAGYLLAVQGSPVRGYLVLDLNYRTLIVVQGTRPRRTYRYNTGGSRERETIDRVCRFLKDCGFRLETAGANPPGCRVIKAGGEGQ
jgi:hypothetical protein